MINRFIFIWLIYWFTFLLQPIESMYSQTYLAFALQSLFVLLVFISFFIGKKIHLGERIFSNNKEFNGHLGKLIIKIAYLLSFFAFLSIIYDKLFIQMIDYSKGLAFAREQWRILGEERVGSASSFFSIFGYLFGSSYFISLIVLFCPDFNCSDKFRLKNLTLGFLFLIGNSMLIGGRSPILLLIFLISFSLFSSKKKLFINRIFYKYIYLFFIIAFLYVIYVFISRAEGTGISIVEYSFEFLEYLGLKPYELFLNIDANSIVFQVFSVINLTISYLTHSFATTASIFQVEYDNPVLLFQYYYVLLFKIGILEYLPEEWALSGRFISVPGALYAQFGWVGFFFFSILLGSISGMVIKNYYSKKNFTNLFACAVVESILLSSPFLFIADGIFFPFMISGGLMAIGLSNIIINIKKYNSNA